MLTQHKISLTSGRKPQFVVGGAVSGTLAQAPPDKGLGSNAKRAKCEMQMSRDPPANRS